MYLGLCRPRLLTMHGMHGYIDQVHGTQGLKACFFSFLFAYMLLLYILLNKAHLRLA